MFSCLNVFIWRKMKANTFFSSSLICARPPRSLHLDSHPRVSGIILKQQPDSRADKGQQRASGEPANSLSLSPACLSNRSMWAQGHLVFKPEPSSLCSTQPLPLSGSPLEERAPQESVWQMKRGTEVQSLMLICPDRAGLVMTLPYCCLRFAGHSNQLRWADWCLLGDLQSPKQPKTSHRLNTWYLLHKHVVFVCVKEMNGAETLPQTWHTMHLTLKYLSFSGSIDNLDRGGQISKFQNSGLEI